MDTSRLKRVQDCCPFGRARWFLHATHWYASVTDSSGPIIEGDFGYTTTILENWLISWHRTFTVSPTEPPAAPSRAKIRIQEWLTPVEPGPLPGWHIFGTPHQEGLVFLDEPVVWSSQARRHLKDFKKTSRITLRLGSVDDYIYNVASSQIPKNLQTIFTHLLQKFIAAHPNDVEILVAEGSNKEIFAVFAVANCHEIKQSYYITGFFNTKYEKSRAMVGLVDWWFTRSRAANINVINFGDMCGPVSFLRGGARGYSIFKTHFGARRVWFPKNRWKITYAEKNLAPKP